jgi:hypothetical protein
MLKKLRNEQKLWKNEQNNRKREKKQRIIIENRLKKGV